MILRHYLDIENGDYYRALGRYNGSLGRAEYPQAVMAAQPAFHGYARSRHRGDRTAVGIPAAR